MVVVGCTLAISDSGLFLCSVFGVVGEMSVVVCIISMIIVLPRA